MHLSKRIINALGALVVTGIVVAGLLLVALPMYSDSAAMGRESAQIDETNQAHALQVRALEADRDRLGAIEASIDALRAQIPADGTLDDVFEIVAIAALSTGATLESAVSEPSQAWAARPEAVSVLEAPREGVAADAVPDAAADEAAAADADPAAADPAASDPAASENADATAQPPAAAAAPEAEVPFVIVAEVADSAAAAAFIDALRAGPRRIGITHVELVQDGSTGTLRLTVNALAFVRTES